MKFLVILICLTINYLWLKDFDRFDDGWFFRFRSRMESITSNAVSGSSSGWLLGLIAIYAVPLVSLSIILVLVEDRLFGLMTMLVHILVLLVAFDRTQPGKLASDFLEKWKLGDMKACLAYLQQELPTSEIPDTADEKELGRYFSKQLIYRCFEKMFVMFFWYMITGPIGILFCYVSYQLRDSRSEEHLAAQLTLIASIIRFLEWIPIRLLAIAFCLAGNFVKCFENVKGSFWDFSKEADHPDLLYSYATCALSGLIDDYRADTEDENPKSKYSPEVAEIEALLGLLERSQAIWLSVLALITILEMRI